MQQGSDTRDLGWLQAIAAAVEPERVLARLDQLGVIGGQPSGGVTRIAFSQEEREATDLVASWMRDAGLTASFDSFGNMFGASDGNQPGAAVSMAGSHLDTVPNGGRFDGALGVVAAVEGVLAMRSAGFTAPRPLEVVVWRCEEPVRFSQGKAGSLLFSGQLAQRDLRPIEDPPLDIKEALARDGERPRRADDRAVATCLELHIEQGRRLEQAGRQVGVVTAVAAPTRLRITIEGRADHSGATPMQERHDALCAAAEIVLEVERQAHLEAMHGTVATSANLTCLPGTMNVIPGEATLLVDIRGIDAASIVRLVDKLRLCGQQIESARGVHIRTEVLSQGAPTLFDAAMVNVLKNAVQAIGYDPMLLASGAGHDTQCLAQLADVGMLFVPSVGGVSHSPEEFTHADDVIAGVRAMAACWALMSAYGEPASARNGERPG
ncbi:MAG: amidase, hydantoinase/carbamoylase family [Chloroflexi bacterium]|nr:amidase, hydantoinase/carbamoylase family [Chloroflexota bacterium]